MSPIDWAVRPFRKFADFSGRAPRAEYWWFTLGVTLTSFLLGFVDDLLGGPVVGIHGPLSLLFTLAAFVPGLAVLVRRLHDVGRSGWWALLSFGGYAFMVIGFTGTNPEEPFGALQGFGTGALLALVAAWIISAIVLLVFVVTRGEDGSNRYGSDPYGPDQLEEIFA